MRPALVHGTGAILGATRHAGLWRRHPARAHGYIARGERQGNQERRETPDEDRHCSKDAGSRARVSNRRPIDAERPSSTRASQRCDAAVLVSICVGAGRAFLRRRRRYVPSIEVRRDDGLGSSECHIKVHMSRVRTRVGNVVFVILPLISACGSSPSAPSEPDATITIGAAGVFPTEVRIRAWGQVRFVNNDTRPHTMVSDPVDLHTQCPPINLVGILQPGESRSTGTLNLTGTCGFHDHNNLNDVTLRGRIVVQ